MQTKIQRCLAQNHEAARKSRLQKNVSVCWFALKQMG
ncbi:hypothetical protein ES332_D10G168900v1 [Gossypium tomentosum]|uniref:Uncharacterized protein n=1 Tax=Gossypium tomentosum TaxID=34277 RepID=A0A5D2J4U6_GOSTO|nr:hypothetical protein ES332_D10G168900v1 [Gossypium tomentosum]